MSDRKFLCIQRSASNPTGREAPSPLQMQQLYEQFTAWKQKFSAQLIDLGGKLGGGKVVTSSDVKDGPFTESKEIVGGYMIVSAASLEEAVEIARQSPGVVFPGSSVEVREILAS